MMYDGELELTEREQEFVKTESNFINGALYHKRDVARAMARDHRYLVGQRGELCIEYLKVLAMYERKGWYDPRDEWACKWTRGRSANQCGISSIACSIRLRTMLLIARYRHCSIPACASSTRTSCAA